MFYCVLLFYCEPPTTQEHVFQSCARPVISDIMEGYNGTIFAYGQTGAGKSFSMMGDTSNPELYGIIPRATSQIFEYIDNAPMDVTFSLRCFIVLLCFTVFYCVLLCLIVSYCVIIIMDVTFSLSVSYLEVYREVIRDLLDPSKSNLAVRESTSKGVYVDGATSCFVTCEDEVFEALALGDAARAVAATNMNATSSRSHSIFTMKVTQKNESDGSTKVGLLNLVDLAGSEKIAKTGASGDTLEEAKKINQSLSALANVINALADSKPHVPFRDSKLTRMLQNSLGGNCKTSLIVACSPHSNNEAETMSTLRFGQRAKTIKTVVKMNEQKSAEELEAIVNHLRAELAKLQAYANLLEEKLKAAGIELPDKKAVSAAMKTRDKARDQRSASSTGGVGSASGEASALSSLEVGQLPATLTGRDAATLEKIQMEYKNVLERERYAKEELEEMRQEASEAQMEARKAEKQVADLQALREKERILAGRAVADVKALRQEVAKKNALGMQALQEMKKLQLQLAQRDAGN
eukprot:SAG31_NODE_1119_length_9813_cov_49.321289_1_plen_522_part_00